MKKSVFILYATDTWHTVSSRLVIAACSSRKRAIKLAREYAKIENTPLDEEQQELLERIGQTQGYTGEGEFDIVELPLNKAVLQPG